jgi:flavin reductase (DIM6/NTAB) family NADH-FMN oxidoreductase RutF
MNGAASAAHAIPDAPLSDDVSPALFKAGMRQIASTVNIITTVLDGQRSGLTATAVCPVCADPPTLLVCVNRDSGTFASLRDAGKFCVNVLGSPHGEAAMRFSSSTIRGESKFEGDTWLAGTSGLPVLEGALASFECKTLSLTEVGTHGLFLARVTNLTVADSGQPLLYFNGALAQLRPLTDNP